MTASQTDEQQDFVGALRDFCARECGTREQRDRLTDHGKHQHSDELYSRLADLGWLGVGIPEAYGGSGSGMVDACLFLEETARGLAPTAGFGTTLIVAGAYERFASEEQKRRVLGGIVAGQVEAIAMSEPEAGSDVGGLTCSAVRQEGGGFLVNGQKTWISNAHQARGILIIARTDRTGSKHEGLTMLDVPTGTPGMEVRSIETLGGTETNDVFFTDCFVGDEAVIGVEGQGWMQLMAGLNVERLIIGAIALGMAERAFDDVLAYVKERKQFGRPIGSFQALKHRLADMATELECAKLLVYDVARKVDADPNQLLPREASMAKLKATEVAKHVSLEGMQMMGGYGHAVEYDMQAIVRQALVSTVYGGTSEIQREIVAKTYGL
ncbi:MAG: acyl-CoA dehydrogenase [Solirubrobacterales bacterium]|nr:acyl-CoA dehydrogenase [Solirubrobacterales bacterium]